MNIFLILGLFGGVTLAFFLSYYLTIEFNQRQSNIAFEELENKIEQFNEESNFLREQMALQARNCAQTNSSINCMDSVKTTYRNLLFSIIERHSRSIGNGRQVIRKLAFDTTKSRIRRRGKTLQKRHLIE